MAGANERREGSDPNETDGKSAANRSDVAGSASATADGSGRPCPVCGAAMDRRHCKYVCPNHGVVYDCSDTFW